MNNALLNCCQICNERFVGCHNEKVCEKWKQSQIERKRIKEIEERERKSYSYSKYKD